MAKKPAVPTAFAQIYEVLEPFETEERRRIVNAVLSALGETGHAAPPSQTAAHDSSPGSTPLPNGTRKLAIWMQQNQITQSMLEQLFHTDGQSSECIASEIPGSSMKTRMVNCYLLAGVRNLLARDESTFSDSEGLALCKQHACYDQANHSSYRKSALNLFAGDKERGFALTQPGRRAAADLIRNWSP